MNESETFNVYARPISKVIPVNRTNAVDWLLVDIRLPKGVHMRLDPAHILVLEPGEAVVMRNIGGRITPGLLAQLRMLGQIGQTEGKIPGGGGEFHVVVLQHTDCGIKRLTRTPALLADYFQVEETGLAPKFVLDPKAAVAADVKVLRTVPGLPGDWFVSGLVYDVQTGLIQSVIAPTAISA